MFFYLGTPAFLIEPWGMNYFFLNLIYLYFSTQLRREKQKRMGAKGQVVSGAFVEIEKKESTKIKNKQEQKEMYM